MTDTHTPTQDRNKPACKDQHTYARLHLGTCNSTGVLGCLHVPVCSVCLPAHLSVMLFGLQSICCCTYSNNLPLCLYALPFPFCPSVRLSVCLQFSAPKCSTYQRYFSFCNRKLSLHLTPFVSSAGDELKRGISPLPCLSLFTRLLYLCASSILPPFLLLSPLFLKNTSLCTSLQVSHLFPSSLAYPCLYRPPTACSHSYGEYVSRKYYHTK